MNTLRNRYAFCALKVELKQGDMTYEQFAERMKEHGFKEAKASIANRLSRGTFAAPFYLAALVPIGCRTVKLEEI